MARTHTIHLTLSFHTKRIPNHASTHYTFTIYPTKDIAPKTKNGFARKPTPQRKIIKDARPLAEAPHASAPVAAPNPKKQHGKFRKNINKRALAAYFDNNVKLSRAAAIEQWRNAVVAELEAADKIAAQNADTARKELRQFVESGHDIQKHDYYTDYFMWHETTSASGIWDEYYLDPDYDLYFGNFEDPKINDIPNDNTELSEEDDFYLFATEEDRPPHRSSLSGDLNAKINESIVNRFTHKYNGADTAAAMRAFEKQKRHNTKLARMLHELQITK